MVVDITENFDRKVAALKCHVSQVGHRDGLDKLLKEWSRTVAKTAELGKGRLAEGYRRISTA
jgi:hypothetical protein